MTASIAPREQPYQEPPLVVDLDGTLIKTDTLIEGLLLLCKKSPWTLLRLPFVLLSGRHAFKRAVFDQVALAVEWLPYDERLLERLREARGRRELVLCTAADQRVATAVADHLGLFDQIIATDGAVNLSGSAKADALVERFGSQRFDYAGNATADLPVFARARQAWIVSPTAGLRRRLGQVDNVALTLPGTGLDLRPAWRTLRSYQWIKNVLVFVPLLAAGELTHLDLLIPTIFAFIAFSLIASSVYVMNDLLDLPEDRAHPRKRRRPLASSSLSAPAGVLLWFGCILLGGLISATLTSPLNFAWMAFYFLLSTAYSLRLKQVPLLDTLLLAGLYTLRILAGAAAINLEPSVWLLAFSMFLFLSLAVAKRHSELLDMPPATAGTIPGRGYRRDDAQVLISQGTAAGYAAVLVLALYIDSESVRRQYLHPQLIWLICPLLMFWINKLWLSSQRGQVHDDPIVWALKNRVSRAIAVASLLVLLVARFFAPL